MRKTITKQWLVNINACEGGIILFENQKERDTIKIIKLLIRNDMLEWAGWLLKRLFTSKQEIQYINYAPSLELCWEKEAGRKRHIKVLNYGIRLLKEKRHVKN